jgi:hypothetical protein
MDISDLVTLTELGRIALGVVVLAVVIWVLQARHQKAGRRRPRRASRRSLGGRTSSRGLHRLSLA